MHSSEGGRHMCEREERKKRKRWMGQRWIDGKWTTEHEICRATSDRCYQPRPRSRPNPCRPFHPEPYEAVWCARSTLRSAAGPASSRRIRPSPPPPVRGFPRWHFRHIRCWIWYGPDLFSGPGATTPDANNNPAHPTLIGAGGTLRSF
jgi:hypothetical protein